MTNFRHGDRPVTNVHGGRSPVLAMNGMVATSQPLASAAGLRVLQDGGNAVDAAITSAAVLNVVEPMMTGIGGDMFAVLFMQQDGRPVALNGSGWTGLNAAPGFFQSRGLDRIPSAGIHSVSVPGAVAGWFKLHARYGKLPMSRLLDPAIRYAEEGFPVSEIISGQWKRQEDLLQQTADAARTYLLDGRAPRHGELFKNPNLARSLKLIAENGRDVFYKGEIAQKLIEFLKNNDGLLTLDDFAEYDAQWTEPARTEYRGYELYEMADNTQGTTALEMINILEGFELASFGHNSANHIHLMVEAKKLAFADRDRYIADPQKAKAPLSHLIRKSYAQQRRRLIDTTRAAASVQPGMVEDGETVYLTVVDKDRNAVSFINSIFGHFGSGLVGGDTGIVLQNRGSLFELQPNHLNCVAPRKRPFHTLIPALVLKDRKPFMSFGVMGGDMQPQGHAQVLVNVIDFGMDAQQAGEAARFRHSAQGLALESGFAGEVRYELAERGHSIIHGVDVFGGYQGIIIDPKTGALMGGSDVRKDGLAIGW